MKDNLDAIDQIKTTAIDLAMKFGPKLLTAIIIVVIGMFAARWAAGADRKSTRLNSSHT